MRMRRGDEVRTRGHDEAHPRIPHPRIPHLRILASRIVK